MNVKDISKQFGFNNDEFVSWIKCQSGRVPFVDGAFKFTIPDDAVEDAIQGFRQHLIELERIKNEAAAQAAREKAQRKKAAEEKRYAMAAMLISSGFNFEGYSIVKYSGYISGDDVIQVNRGTSFLGNATNVGDALSASLSQLRSNALAELKEAAWALGCNAVIGVDFDYMTLEPETANINGGTTYLPYVFCVTANGNAVVIEKNAASEREE